MTVREMTRWSTWRRSLASCLVVAGVGISFSIFGGGKVSAVSTRSRDVFAARRATASQIRSFVEKAEHGGGPTWTAAYQMTVAITSHRSRHMTLVAAQENNRRFTYQERGPGGRGDLDAFWWPRKSANLPLLIYLCDRSLTDGRWTCENMDKPGNGPGLLMDGYPKEAFFFGLENAVYEYPRAFLVRERFHGNRLLCLDFDSMRRPVARVCLDSRNLVARYAVPISVSTNGTNYEAARLVSYSTTVPPRLFRLPTRPEAE